MSCHIFRVKKTLTPRKMKKTLLLSFCMFYWALSSNAQYYYVPFFNAGTNPNGLNVDAEFPVGGGLTTGWTTILPAFSTAWSVNQTIPFAFQFNGSAVTGYKISASGVLTFDLTATAVPGGANTTIPSSSIPNNSVLIWGLASSGTNDVVASKTFGTAPNRQHWVFFTSYSAVGIPTTAWTYWSIVLEESSNKIYLVDQRTNNPQTLSLTLGIQINNSTAIQVAGSPSINSLTANAPDQSDNSYYEFIPGTNPIQRDLSLTGTNLPAPFISPTSSQSLTVNVRNNGAIMIDSFTVNYTINNGSVNSFPQTNQGITYLNTVTINPNVSLPANTVGYRKIKIWISGVNGDQNAANDTLLTGFTVANDSMLTNRKVLIESFTSSTCGPCASVAPSWNAYITNNNANTVSGNITVVKLQQNYPAPGTDLAATQEAIFRHNWYGVSGIPRALVDGIVFNGSPSTIVGSPTIVSNRQAVKSAFSFNLSSSYSGNTVTLNGGVTSLVGFNSNQIRIFAAILENQYTNTVGGSTSETTFFKVLRKMLPDRNGLVITNVEPNQNTTINLSHTFVVGNVTQNSGNIFTNMGNLSLVIWVQHTGTKEVLQSHWQPISIVSGIANEPSTFNGFEVFPNPATDRVQLQFNLSEPSETVVSLTDLKGALVRQVNLGVLSSGNQQTELSTMGLSPGLYLLRLNSGNSQVTKKLMINE
jgi:hypothetical protein